MLLGNGPSIDARRCSMVTRYVHGYFGMGWDADAALADAIERKRIAEHWAAGELHFLAVAR